MKLEDEIKDLVKAHRIQFKFLPARNSFVQALVKLISKKQETARLLGYEQGRWDRPTNTGGGI